MSTISKYNNNDQKTWDESASLNNLNWVAYKQVLIIYTNMIENKNWHLQKIFKGKGSGSK